MGETTNGVSTCRARAALERRKDLGKAVLGGCGVPRLSLHHQWAIGHADMTSWQVTQWGWEALRPGGGAMHDPI